MEYIQAALRGDIAKAADLSFDCLLCGLCASRCPAEIVQYHVALLCRRLYSRHVAPAAEHLKNRVKEVRDGKFDSELAGMKKMSQKELAELYAARVIETDD
jgi:L-lactate utilization protein LutB